MSGVMIKVTNADGEESQVDVEAVDPRPLTPRKLRKEIGIELNWIHWVCRNKNKRIQFINYVT